MEDLSDNQDKRNITQLPIHTIEIVDNSTREVIYKEDSSKSYLIILGIGFVILLVAVLTIAMYLLINSKRRRSEQEYFPINRSSVINNTINHICNPLPIKD